MLIVISRTARESTCHFNMNNLPEGIYSWELDAPEHFPACLDQQDGLECICDEIEISMKEAEAEAQMEFERGN